jgi:hypothetical protein
MGETKGSRQRIPDERELIRLKRELTAARERGEQGALARMVRAHAAYAGELAQFALALVATSSYEHEMPTPETEAITARATARAMATVFAAQAAAPVVAAEAPAGARALGATLAALRRARNLSLAVVARQLGLGVDVLQGIETGLIRAASVPDSFTHVLGELLELTAEQVRTTLITQPAVQPALRRQKGAGEMPELDFTEAVRLSPGMTPEQKARWLDG